MGQYWGYAWAPGNQGTVLDGRARAGLHEKDNQEDHLGTVGGSFVECDCRYERLERLAVSVGVEVMTPSKIQWTTFLYS